MGEKGKAGNEGNVTLRQAIAQLILTEIGPSRKLTPVETDVLGLDKDTAVELGFTAVNRRITHLVDDIERLIKDAKPDIEGLRADLDRTIDHQAASIMAFYEEVRALPEASQNN